MRFSVRLSSVRKIFRWIKRIFVVGLILAIGYGGYWLYQDINRVWNDPNTWVNPYIKLPKKIDHLKIYIKKDPVKKTIEYKIDYALLYDIKEEGDFLVYKFSLMPWSVWEAGLGRTLLKDSTWSAFFFKVSRSTPPNYFLDRGLGGVEDYTILNYPQPVAVSIRYRIHFNRNLYREFKHYWIVRVARQKDYYSVETMDWGVTSLLPKDKDQLRKRLKEWARSFMKQVFWQLKGKGVDLENPAYRRVVSNSTSARSIMFKKLRSYFSRSLGVCNIQGCSFEGFRNPATPYLAFVQALEVEYPRLGKWIVDESRRHLSPYCGLSCKSRSQGGEGWYSLQLYEFPACGPTLVSEGMGGSYASIELLKPYTVPTIFARRSRKLRELFNFLSVIDKVPGEIYRFAEAWDAFYVSDAGAVSYIDYLCVHNRGSGGRLSDHFTKKLWNYYSEYILNVPDELVYSSIYLHPYRESYVWYPSMRDLGGGYITLRSDSVRDFFMLSRYLNYNKGGENANP